MRHVVIHVTAGSCLAALLLAGGGLLGSEDAAAPSPLAWSRGLALRAEVFQAERDHGDARIAVTLLNEGEQTATQIQPLVLPPHFRLLRDGCTAQPLPAAASCSYTLALDPAGPRAGTVGLEVRYDYAGLRDLSAGGTVSYPAVAAVASTRLDD
jgi:hypothetical protein